MEKLILIEEFGIQRNYIYLCKQNINPEEGGYKQ
jgi:hypothetical protein